MSSLYPDILIYMYMYCAVYFCYEFVKLFILSYVSYVIFQSSRECMSIKYLVHVFSSLFFYARIITTNRDHGIFWGNSKNWRSLRCSDPWRALSFRLGGVVSRRLMTPMGSYWLCKIQWELTYPRLTRSTLSKPQIRPENQKEVHVTKQCL